MPISVCQWVIDLSCIKTSQNMWWHFHTWSCYSLTFHKSQKMPFSTPTKSRRKQYKLSCSVAVGLAAFCMTAWYGATKEAKCHHKPLPLGCFFFYWVLQCSTATLSACYWADRNLACLPFLSSDSAEWTLKWQLFVVFLQVAEQLQYVIACILSFWRSLWLFFSLNEGRSYDLLHRRNTVVQYDRISISIFKAGGKQKLVWEYKCSHNDMVRTSFKDRLQSPAVKRLRTCYENNVFLVLEVDLSLNLLKERWQTIEINDNFLFHYNWISLGCEHNKTFEDVPSGFDKTLIDFLTILWHFTDWEIRKTIDRWTDNKT